MNQYLQNQGNDSLHKQINEAWERYESKIKRSYMLLGACIATTVITIALFAWRVFL